MGTTLSGDTAYLRAHPASEKVEFCERANPRSYSAKFTDSWFLLSPAGVVLCSRNERRKRGCVRVAERW